MMEAKRKHERYPYKSDVTVVFENGETHPAQVLNISHGGAFLWIEPLPPFSSKITLLIELPGVPDTCKIPSYVRWFKKGEGMGISFQYIRPIEVWALNKLLRKIKEQQEEE